MNTTEIKSKDLKQGLSYLFETEDKEDYRIAELMYSEKSKLFVIWFNGACLHGSKSISSLKNRFEALRIKWGLKYLRTDNNNS